MSDSYKLVITLSDEGIYDTPQKAEKAARVWAESLAADEVCEVEVTHVELIES